MDFFSFVLVGLCVTLAFILGYAFNERFRQAPRVLRTLPADSPFTHPTSNSEQSRTSSQCSPRVKDPKTFSGEADCFKEWSFSVDLALRSHGITQGQRQVDFAASYLEGSSSLWFISRREAGVEFQDWPALREQLAATFGPLHEEEDSRLALFSLFQTGSLDEYVRAFSRLSLCVSDIDELSRALLFVRGLSDDLRPDAMREHPKNLSQAIRAARTARRCSNLSSRRQRNAIIAPNSSEISPRMDNRRKKLDQAEREQLKREGRCFKCRKDGHLSKDCPERNPNARRQ